MEIKILSNSKWNAYDQCPLRFEFQFVKKVKVSLSPILYKGIAVHEIYRKFFKYIQDNNVVIESPESQFPNIIQWNPEYDFEIRAFLAKEAQRWHMLQNKALFVPAVMERRLTDNDLGYGGTPDRIDLDDDGEYHLVDYKTGQVRSFPAHYKTQLSGYVHLANAKQLTPKPVKRATIFWVSQGKFKTADVDTFYEEKDFKEQIQTMLKTIREDNSPKAKPGPLCVFCDYHRYCGACRHSLAKFGHLAKKHNLQLHPYEKLGEFTQTSDFYEDVVEVE